VVVKSDPEHIWKFDFETSEIGGGTVVVVYGDETDATNTSSMTIFPASKLNYIYNDVAGSAYGTISAKWIEKHDGSLIWAGYGVIKEPGIFYLSVIKNSRFHEMIRIEAGRNRIFSFYLKNLKLIHPNL
jgi:hypothetical protein